jgi:phytoene desaturase
LNNAIVIGAGIGGLSAAVRLAAQGYNVDVYEQNDGPGGKLTEFTLGDYRFDFGPSLFTMPQYVMELFEVAGKDPADYFEYEAMDEACRYFFTDGTNFFAPTEEQAFIDKAARVFEVDRSKIEKYFSYNKKIFEEAGQIFLTKPIQKLKTWMSSDVLKFLAQSYVIELFRSMNDTNTRMLEEPRLVQMFNRYATYNGSNPYKAPAILNSISVLEHLYGTYFPKGGMSRIAKSIYQLGKDLGVTYQFSQPVEEILVEKGRTCGIRTSEGKHEADVVVCNMDVNFAYDRLLPGHELPTMVKKAEKSSSAVIWYWGVGKQDENLGLHNIFFTNDYPTEFDHLFNKKTLYEDPTVYINITSTQEASDAPSHGGNWFVMINAPSDVGQDWEREVTRTREKVIAKLTERLGWDVGAHIEEERVVTPKDIETLTYSHKGALYGTSSNSQISAFLRHPNMTRKIKGLYFVGGSVHPGGGIPLCLLSSKITSELIKAHE